MAHKKGQGSVRNGRDSLSKRRGVKKYAGEFVTQSSILVTQCGTKFRPGRYVRIARNDTLHAEVDGTVYFDQDGRRVNILPTPRPLKGAEWGDEVPDALAVLDRPVRRTQPVSKRIPGSGTRAFPKSSGQPPRTPVRQEPIREVDKYYKKLIARRGKTMERDKHPPTDLELVARPENQPAHGFGATVAPDGYHLFLPPVVFGFLDAHFVTTATGFVAYVRAFPEVVAEGLHLKKEEVVSALPELVREVAKVLPAEALAEVPSDQYGYGTLD